MSQSTRPTPSLLKSLPSRCSALLLLWTPKRGAAGVTGVPRESRIEDKSSVPQVMTRLALIGFGNVGRALARMLLRTGAPFTVTALGTRRHGAVVAPEGISLPQVLAGTDLPMRALPPVAELPADVLVELTTLEPRTGEPALS